MASEQVIKQVIALAQAGQPTEARRILMEHLKDNRDDAAAWAIMARLAKNDRERIFSLEQVLRIKPGDAWAREELGKLQGGAAAPSAPTVQRPSAGESLLRARQQDLGGAAPTQASPQAQRPEEPPSSARWSDEPPKRSWETPAPPAPQYSALSGTQEAGSPGPISSGGSWDDAPDSGADEYTPAVDADWLDTGDIPTPEPIETPQVSKRGVGDESWRENLGKTTQPGEQQSGGQRGRTGLMIVLGVILVCVLCALVLAIGLQRTVNNLPGLLSGGGLPAIGGGGNASDNYDTTLEQNTWVGGTGSGRIGSLSEAHNWYFSGQAGQTVQITVTGDGSSDPQFKLIAPSGSLVGSDDDSGGNSGAYLSVTLPETGTYTVRIDMWTPGGYTLYIQ